MDGNILLRAAGCSYITAYKKARLLRLVDLNIFNKLKATVSGCPYRASQGNIIRKNNMGRILIKTYPIIYGILFSFSKTRGTNRSRAKNFKGIASIKQIKKPLLFSLK